MAGILLELLGIVTIIIGFFLMFGIPAGVLVAGIAGVVVANRYEWESDDAEA